jgi:hypothetical protein
MVFHLDLGTSQHDVNVDYLLRTDDVLGFQTVICGPVIKSANK